MKKCPKCNIEYDDNDSFCPVCGGKLVPVDACPNCGKPINVNDVFCRHCGCRIEKEYRCKKCNAVIPENSKFCPECGEKIVDPVVSVPNKNIPVDAAIDRSLFKKVLFFAGHAVFFILLILLFVGCFGAIYKAESSQSLGIGNSETTIAYFFGEAIDNIKAATANNARNDYRNFLLTMLVLEYINWIFALVSILAGASIGLIGLLKGTNKKTYSFNGKPYLIAFLGVLPYLFIFGVKYSSNISGYSTYQASYYSSSLTTETFYIKQVFGWGTMMVLVCSAVGVCLMGLFRIAQAIISKDSPIRESMSICFKLAFYFLLVFALFRVVDINYVQTNGSIKGYFSAYEAYTTALQTYSNQRGETVTSVPEGAVYCLISIILLYVGGLIGVTLFGGFFESKKFDVLVAFGLVLMLVLFISGYALAQKGVSDYLYELYLGMIPKEAFKYSPMGIAMPIVATLSVVGFGVVSSLKIEK